MDTGNGWRDVPGERVAHMTREALAARLEERILSGELPAGAKLPSERQLAERFGMSRTVVREALRSLIERNLVEVQPGRGAFVRRARTSDAAARLGVLFRRQQATPRDLVEARTMLECTAAALAAERADPAALAAIDAALAQFDRANGVIEQTRGDLAFHLAIARAAGNPVIETMFGAITGVTVELMLRSLADLTVIREAVPYHREIAGAIRAHEPERARAAMASHLAVAAQLYGEDFDRSIESVARRELARLLTPGVTLDDLLAVAAPAAEEGSDGRTGQG